MATEAAFRRYCSSSLVKEYDLMNSEAKTKLLDAMITGQRDTIMQYTLQASMSGKKKLNTKQVNEIMKKSSLKDCPLVQAFLHLGVIADALVENEEHLQQCRNNLKEWGNLCGKSPMDKYFHYQQVVYVQKETYRNDKRNHHMYSTNSTVIKQSSSGSDRFDWKNLRLIKIHDLKLFETSWKCYLEGTIVGEAIQPMTGGTVLIQDTTGDYLLVTFYNFLPEGIRGLQAEPFLQKIFPIGAKIRIAEPFTKIFRDGQRGIRVDNRSDIQRVDDIMQHSKKEEKECSNAALEERKKEGNEFFGKKSYSAAIDVYADALNSTDFIPTLLSNRCQAFICQEQWLDGLLDAAASLTIRPESSKKTWARYNLCLSKVKENGDVVGNNRDILRNLIPHLKPPSIDNKEMNPIVNTELGESLKCKGNDAFKQKNYTDAISYYSQALLETGATVRTLLNNWSQCAIEIEALNDVIASACAAIRIGIDEKSVYRLCKCLCYIGETDLAIMILKLFPTSKTLKQLCDDAKNTKSLLWNPNIIDREKLTFDTPPLLSRWIGPVETYMTMDKGRGLRAGEDLTRGQIIFIDRALAKAEPDMNNIFTSSKGNRFDAPATVKLKCDLVHRCNVDSVLSDIVSHLADGCNDKPLVPLQSLIRTLDSCQILLPGLFTYTSDNKDRSSNLTTENIHAIIDMNIHKGKNGETDLRKIAARSSSKNNNNNKHERFNTGSNLYSLISSINHSKDPNCMFCPTNDSSVAFVITSQAVMKGKELCLSYTDDEIEAARHWKF